MEMIYHQSTNLQTIVGAFHVVLRGLKQAHRGESYFCAIIGLIKSKTNSKLCRVGFSYCSSAPVPLVTFRVLVAV